MSSKLIASTGAKVASLLRTLALSYLRPVYSANGAALATLPPQRALSLSLIKAELLAFNYLRAHPRTLARIRCEIHLAFLTSYHVSIQPALYAAHKQRDAFVAIRETQA